MNFPPNGNHIHGPQISALDAYLNRGTYEKQPELHSSYNTVCEHIATANPGSVIAIDGPSSGGKTSLTEALVNFYETQGVPVAFLSLDHFLINRQTRGNINHAIREGQLAIPDYSGVGWEQAHYLENIMLAKHLATTSDSPQVLHVPYTYDRQTGENNGVHSLLIHPGSIIITEGVGTHTYHGNSFDKLVRVDTHDGSLLLERVLEREHKKPQGVPRQSDDFLQMRYNIVDAPHTAYLRENAPPADYVLDTTNFDQMLLYKHH